MHRIWADDSFAQDYRFRATHTDRWVWMHHHSAKRRTINSYFSLKERGEIVVTKTGGLGILAIFGVTAISHAT